MKVSFAEAKHVIAGRIFSENGFILGGLTGRFEMESNDPDARQEMDVYLETVKEGKVPLLF